MIPIPSIYLIDEMPVEEKQDILAHLLTIFQLKHLCNIWEISIATYYRYTKRWGLNLPEIQQRKKALVDKKRISIPIGSLLTCVEEVMESHELIRLLNMFHDSLDMTKSEYQVDVDITKLSDPEVKARQDILDRIFKSIPDKLSGLAHWMTNYEYPINSLHSCSLNTRGLYALLGLLESVHDSLEMKEGQYQIEIGLSKISSIDHEQHHLLAPNNSRPQPEKKQVTALAYWISNYEFPNDLLPSPSFEAQGLLASFEHMKLPMIRDLKPKKYFKDVNSFNETKNVLFYNESSREEEKIVYRFSGSCTFFELLQDLKTMVRFFTHMKGLLRVTISIS
ncbi:hypothetical protein ABES02_29460 [Neobacillus pocheonensis]|uniref:hypothetical protein n=1 Tax=Neobacillus pocheonensis TaxID=363869 RepID=UPI003D26D345